MSVFHRLTCPLDQSPLRMHEGSLICSQGHSFDLAKSGYINLLPVQKKHSKDPGDSKEMVQMRRTFLNGQFYQPIAQGLAQFMAPFFSSHQEQSLAEDNTEQTNTMTLLDAGCGEGYYLAYLQQAYPHKVLDSIGLDISKWAIQAASKRNKSLGWVVGSNANLPMPEQRFNGIMCLFGFPVWSEFQRVLNQDGYVFLVDAAANHLIELREILYPHIKPYQATDYNEVAGFKLLQETTLTFQFTLTSNEALLGLASMTPHFYKAPYEGKQKLAQLKNLTITGHVRLTCLQKTGQ